MDFFRNVSLKIKLLGIYFMGLVLLGVVGYGFFIYLEIDNYLRDKEIFDKQAQYFQEKSFNHMKYTMDLHGILTKLYTSAGEEQLGREDIIREFVNNVLLFNDNQYAFALYDFSGDLISSSGSEFETLMNFSPGNRAKIVHLIKQAYETRIHGSYIDFAAKDEPRGYFVNTMYFEPLNYYIMSLDKTEAAEKNINSILKRKRMEIIKAVGFSFLLGLVATIIVIGFLFTYLRGMTKNINSITESIDALAASGETDMKLKAGNKDEIGRMIEAFNNYLQKRINMERFKQLIEEDQNIVEVYTRIFTLLDTFGIKNFAIYEVDDAKNRINYLNHEICGDSCTLEPMPCASDILIHADECRAKRLAQTVMGEPEYRSCPKFLGYDEGRKHMCIPIIIGGTAGEVVHITIKPEKEEEFKNKLPVLQEYLRNASPVIESKKLLKNLRETTLKDPLTGLNNRRFLEEYTEFLIAENRRKNTNIGILMCDLDYFKKVNDVHGHEVGDKVLQMLSAVLKSSVRASDIVVRYGGEEFLVIIKEAGDDEAVITVAEKIRENMQNYEMKISPSVTIKKTLSIGISIFPRDTENFWQAIKFADISLYKAKEEGRNRVIRFRQEFWDDHGEDY
ncbi:diguanylate cyclase [Limisalsivibrio acetivorans]|uniref:diguanylate cyclase n=1 Tax=Limisalsivibrio acetivorans TaxID=1304888 RepID=UPI0003B34B17|nr:diguanylate cyclase [Limisalsivibrio acetivorans]